MPDTEFGLGGMIEMDYETLNWPKLAMLMDNGTDFKYGLGLTPWYMSGFTMPTGEICLLLKGSNVHC